MADDKHQSDDHFSASMPLPDEGGKAADLVRQKIAAAYGQEPDAAQEALDAADLKSSGHLSVHQQFVYDLTTSGKSLPEIQKAWHEYYAGLTDRQKHEVWQEFYEAHARASRFGAVDGAPAPAAQVVEPPQAAPSAAGPGALSRTIGDLKERLIGSPLPRQHSRSKQGFQSLLFGLGVGSIVMLIFLFGFFNERFIAPFVQPSRHISNTPIIGDTSVSSAPEVIIPKINVEIPVIYDVNTIDEASVDNALESGVVHYADTAMPGQDGNVVIVGHSSNNIFNKGRYKFAFVLLSRLDNGDTFYLQKDGKRYTYQVYKKQIVKPTDVSVLGAADKPATATLITCDTPGTSINRLVVTGQQIDPNPSSNQAQVAHGNLAGESAIIPGNAPSLWSRLVSWFTH